MSQDATAIRPHVRAILDAFSLEDVVTHLLRRAHFKAEEVFAAEFRDESVTPRQKAALVILYQNPGLNQNLLAEKLFMDRNTVAEMVRRLSEKGWISRVASAGDARAYELFLAPAGQQLLDRMMERDLAIERRMLERLPEEYRPLFLKCLKLMVQEPGQAQ